MSRKLCLLLAALYVAATVVKSESYIEVDENGDEYEVKKFNIQGRQLNGGRSQCVVTRRKRSTFVFSPDDESNETDEKDYQSYSQASALLFYSPPVVDDDEDNDVVDEDEEELEEDANDNEESNGAFHQTTFAVVDNDDDTEEDDDEPETIKVIQVPQLSVISELHNQGQTLGHIASSAHFMPASTTASVSASPVRNKGIMVYHAHEPPKVNPHTHAVFELLPVKQEQQSAQTPQHDGSAQVLHLSSSGYIVPGDLDDNDDFKFDEEVNPVTTTAIWSTGDDDNYAYPLPPKIDKDPLETETSENVKDEKYNIKTKTKTKKKKSSSIATKNKFDKKTPMRSTSHKNNKRPNKTPKRRPVDKKRPINRRRPISRRRPAIRKRPSSNVPRKYRKRNSSSSRSFSKKRKPNTAKRIKNERIITTSPIGEDIGEMDEDKNHKKDKDKLSEKKQRNNSHDNPKEVGRRYRKRNNANIADQRANSYIRTITMAQMGGSKEHGDVNCIYINKDSQPTKPASTTRRPFLNLMGRSANVGPLAASHYGKRKRINMRILA